MGKIKAVIFDYGNVISVLQDEKSLRAISEATGLPEDAFMGAYDNHAFRNAFDRGDITGAELYSRVIAAKGFEKESRDMALMERAMQIDLEYWHNTNPQVIEWGLQLKNEGYKLGILSNMPHEFLAAYEQHIPLFVHADYACFSCRVKMLKPEAGIYLHTLEKLGVQPDEAVFFDDLPANIETANRLGIHGILWTGDIEAAKKAWAQCLNY